MPWGFSFIIQLREKIALTVAVRMGDSDIQMLGSQMRPGKSQFHFDTYDGLCPWIGMCVCVCVWFFETGFSV